MLKELGMLQFDNMSLLGYSQIYAFNNLGSRVFVVSNKDSCNLITHPELIGLDVRNYLYQATVDSLKYLQTNYSLENINIVNILRGGLNFPLEEACATLNSSVPSISFISSERICDDKNAFLQMKYKKVIPSAKSSILIGDIIASGGTLANIIDFLSECFDECGLSPKNIIVFTIGTYNTLNTIRRVEESLKKRWVAFEGIFPVFYEAIFNVYKNNGVTKLNTIGLDFYLADGFVLPQLRDCYQNNYSAIFEKCAIYDGGDRRFNPEAHMKMICEYWDRLALYNPHEIAAFLKEKIGYDSNISFEDWIVSTGYKGIDFRMDLDALYLKEIEMIRQIENTDFKKICIERLDYLRDYFKEKAGYNYE